MNTDDNGYIVLYEAPKKIIPEFRLYYDDKGKVICYTCEKLVGKYIVVDAMTYAEARPDARVVDGKITTVFSGTVVSKLMPATDGKHCVIDDISIIAPDTYTGLIKQWRMTTYEL